MADATRTVTPKGMVYLPGRVHPFPAGKPLALPTATADALRQAGHLLDEEPIPAEPAAAAPAAAAPPAASAPAPAAPAPAAPASPAPAAGPVLTPEEQLQQERAHIPPPPAA